MISFLFFVSEMQLKRKEETRPPSHATQRHHTLLCDESHAPCKGQTLPCRHTPAHASERISEGLLLVHRGTPETVSACSFPFLSLKKHQHEESKGYTCKYKKQYKTLLKFHHTSPGDESVTRRFLTGAAVRTCGIWGRCTPR